MTFDLKKDIRQYAEFWSIFFFMVCVALICLPFLPETIATHWNGAWQVDGWGTKWTLLEMPLVDAAALLALKWIFIGIRGKYNFGGEFISDPEEFAYHCWLIVSLFFCILEMLMLAQGFHSTAGGPRFLFLTLFGAAFLLIAVWNNRKSKFSWFLDGIGFLFMYDSIHPSELSQEKPNELLRQSEGYSSVEGLGHRSVTKSIKAALKKLKGFQL